jgi:opacity protein-like surface antigen
MRSVKSLVAAGAASLLSSVAFAADMAIMPPPPMSYATPPVEEFGGWYLRGDIGFSNQHVNNVRNGNALLYPDGQMLTQTSSFDTGGIFGVGVGYRLNNWFRADVTAQYRGSANFKGLDRFTNPGGATGFDLYGASKSEWLFLANAYVDLGTWWCVTPFIGAGVGTSRVAIANFTDIGQFSLGGPSWASAPNDAQWNLAWALHAGLAYKVTPNMTVELGYSYLNLGDSKTGVVSNFIGQTTNNVMTFKDITSHDLKLGVRWQLESPQVYAPPLIRKG